MTPSAPGAHSVITDLTVSFSDTTNFLPDAQNWHRIEKELHLHTSRRKAWLYVARAHDESIAAEDLVVKEITVGDPPPNHRLWESRPGGIWVLRKKFLGEIDQAAAEIDVLFGIDAVDPRPQWTLVQSSLELDGSPEVPCAKLSVRYGKAAPFTDTPPILRARENGKFKIVQISDTHMVTGVGVCKDALGANGDHLPESEADTLTVHLIEEILDLEQPDLVVFAGDQLHHDILDSQTAIFKVVAPVVQRSIPFAVVFGNHDSEGAQALSRSAQMSILRTLPFNLSESGPEHVEGVGNFCLRIMAPAPSDLPLSTLYFLDSHGQIPSKIQNPDYAPTTRSQIDWFTTLARQNMSKNVERRTHLSLVFQHIPLPEFKEQHLDIRKGSQREPPECPSSNTHFYDAMVEESISAFGCGHDHVNDFCGLLPKGTLRNGTGPTHRGPWLCYGGTSGFGGYCSYDGRRFHRGMRVWELGTNTGSLVTWKRVEYARDRIDEVELVESGCVV